VEIWRVKSRPGRGAGNRGREGKAQQQGGSLDQLFIFVGGFRIGGGSFAAIDSAFQFRQLFGELFEEPVLFRYVVSRVKFSQGRQILGIGIVKNPGHNKPSTAKKHNACAGVYVYLQISIYSSIKSHDNDIGVCFMGAGAPLLGE
jgi:hypothetical protein